jgi:hypothetical protein
MSPNPFAKKKVPKSNTCYAKWMVWHPILLPLTLTAWPTKPLFVKESKYYLN